MCYNIIKVKENKNKVNKTGGTNKKMKFKKDKRIDGLWEAERIVDNLFISSNEYVIEKEPLTGKYYLYINGAKYSETKTLKTAKKYADEHFRESPKKVFA